MSNSYDNESINFVGIFFMLNYIAFNILKYIKENNVTKNNFITNPSTIILSIIFSIVGELLIIACLLSIIVMLLPLSSVLIVFGAHIVMQLMMFAYNAITINEIMQT